MPHTNEAITSFVTAGAGLHLYGYLDKRMILIGVGGETDTVTVHTERKIKRKRGNGRVQIVMEPKDKTYWLTSLRGDDYTTIRPYPSGI